MFNNKVGAAGGTFLGDFPALTADTDAQIITKLDIAYATAKDGDFVEVIQPLATQGDVNYFLMTKAGTT